MRPLEHRYQQEAISARVVAEPAPYDAGSPHSWARDSLLVADPSMSLRANDIQRAEERLRQHGKDISREIAKRSAYGKLALSMYAESRRQADAAVHETVVRNETGAL